MAPSSSISATFPDYSQETAQYAWHLTAEQHVRFNLGSSSATEGTKLSWSTLVWAQARDMPDPLGILMDEFTANGVRPEDVDMV